MKKRIGLFSIVLLCAGVLCACSGSVQNDAVLWYQEGPAEISGELQGEGGTYTVTLSLGRADDTGSRDITLSFSAPEEMDGMVFRLRGDEIFAVYNTVEIPLSKEAAGDLFAPADLFALREEDVNDIQTAEDGKTLIKLSNGQNYWDVSTDAEGIPQSISATVDGEVLSFSITSFVQTDT